MKYLLIVLAVLFSVSVGFTQGANPPGSAKQERSTAQTKGEYVCPMHPDVKSNEPGKCSKCGMNLVFREVKAETTGQAGKKDAGSANGILSQARALLDGAKKMLAADGKYNCCMKEPCDECALGHQSCRCAENLKAGKGVCSQCYGGWQRGEGKDKSIKSSDVKTSYSTHRH